MDNLKNLLYIGRKRTPKDSKTETPEPQPNYITAILPTESTNNKNYKNQYGGHSNCLRWSQDEVDLQHTIKTPSRICEKEWLATHILSLSNNIKLLYELIGPYCTPSTCPKMCGVRGELFYQEKEGAGNKRETHVFSAPGYADWAFQKLTEIAEDQEYFPTKYGIEFNPGLISEYRRICRILYAILSHMYANHYAQLQQFGDMHLYLNTLFIHLVLLGDDYGLIDSADRTGLDDLIAILAPKGSIVTSSSFNYVQSSTVQSNSGTNQVAQNSHQNDQNNQNDHNNQNNHQNTSVSTSSPPNTPAANDSSSPNFKISANQPIFTQPQSSDIINNQTTAFNDQQHSIAVQDQSTKISDAALKKSTSKSSNSHDHLENLDHEEINQHDQNGNDNIEISSHEISSHEISSHENAGNESFNNESVRSDSLREIEGEGDTECHSTVRTSSPIEDSSGIRISVIAPKVQDTKNYENEGDQFQREAKPDYNNNDTVML